MKMIEVDVTEPDVSHRVSKYTGQSPDSANPRELIRLLGGSAERAVYLGKFPSKSRKMWDCWLDRENQNFVLDSKEESRFISKPVQEYVNNAVTGKFGDARPGATPELEAARMAIRSGEVVLTDAQIKAAVQHPNMRKDLIEWGIIPE